MVTASGVAFPSRRLGNLVEMPATKDEAVELPLACSLPPGEQVPRMERWEALASSVLISAEATWAGVRLRYRREGEVLAELEELARLERDCCGWAEWRVAPAGDEVVLEVTAGGAGAGALQSMFGVVSPPT